MVRCKEQSENVKFAMLTSVEALSWLGGRERGRGPGDPYEPCIISHLEHKKDGTTLIMHNRRKIIAKNKWRLLFSATVARVYIFFSSLVSKS